MKNKLLPRSSACVFIGYPQEHKGYICLDLSTNKGIMSHHVLFDELTFPLASKHCSSTHPRSLPTSLTPDPEISSLDLVPVRLCTCSLHHPQDQPTLTVCAPSLPRGSPAPLPAFNAAQSCFNQSNFSHASYYSRTIIQFYCLAHPANTGSPNPTFPSPIQASHLGTSRLYANSFQEWYYSS
jgi:hypothetical protein